MKTLTTLLSSLTTFRTILNNFFNENVPQGRPEEGEATDRSQNGLEIPLQTLQSLLQS